MMLLGLMPSLAGAQGGDTEKPYWWEELAFVWPATSEGSLVYDPISNRVIALFHEGGEARNDITYAWDGTEWTNLGYVKPDGDLSNARLVYSPKAGKILLYGGKTKWYGTPPETESAIWQMDEQGWTEVARSVYSPIPPARYDEAVATDPSGGLLLFGGIRSDTFLDETWVWDPETQMWTNKTDPGGKNPPARTVASMVYDPENGNVLLFGGFSTKQYWYSPYENPLGDTWLWDGNGWQNVTGEVYGPSPRAGAAMSYDPKSGKIYLFGGEDSNGNFLNDLWAWDGKERTWTLVAENVRDLTGRAEAFFTEGPDGNLLLFGGKYSLNDLWKYDSVSDLWEEIDPPSPSPRSSAAMATDEKNGQVLLFGGTEDYWETMGDTWAWNGVEWIKKRPSTSPSPRHSAAMAFNGRDVLLFGGYNYDSVEDIEHYYDDTWIWDGEDWRKIDTQPGATPPGRYSAAMAYNPLTGQVVMFGGNGEIDTLGDTWVWNGEAWNRVDPREGDPSPRYGASLAFDGKKILLFGGFTKAGLTSNETWLFDGDKWTKVETTPEKTPSARYGATLAYDPFTGKTFLFGGFGENEQVLNDLWMWDPEKREWTSLYPGDGSVPTIIPAFTSPNPSPRVGAGMAYSPANQSFLLFGGEGWNPQEEWVVYQDTWLLHRSNWLKLAGLTLSAAKDTLETGESTTITGQVYGKDGLGLAHIPVTLEVYGGGGFGSPPAVVKDVYTDAAGNYTLTYTAPENIPGSQGTVTMTARIPGTEFNAEKSFTIIKREAPPAPNPGSGSSGNRDITPPTGSILINGGEESTSTCRVTLTLTATDWGTGVKEMRFSNDGEHWTEWEPYSHTKAYTLPPGPGLKKVYVRFRDGAGNVSPAYSDEILSQGACCRTKPEKPPQFTDISGHWAEKEINQGAAEGIVTGYTDGTFQPDRSITRAEFVLMLANAFCLPEGSKELPFTDLNQIPEWTKDALTRAYGAGWIEGYPDLTFRPDRSITRSEMAAILVRALKLVPGTEGDLTRFSDHAEIPGWAKDYLFTTWSNGLMNGRGDRLLAPNGKTTRAETVVFLLRALNLGEKQ